MRFIQAKHFYSGGNIPRLIVIHDEETPETKLRAQWCANFFAGQGGMTAPQASAHYAVDADEIVQCVRDTDGAWHCPGSFGGREINRMSIGIEHSGYAHQTAEDWADDYSVSMLELSAGLVARLCRTYSIPIQKLSPEDLKAGKTEGICGHWDCTLATGVGSHTDPGPHFPWDWYMERVRAIASALDAPPATPETGATDWVRVKLGAEVWEVSPTVVAPIGIGAAVDLAKRLGCELPSPALCDAIWLQADLKIDGRDMVFTQKEGNDFTAKTMAAQSTFALTTKKLEALIGGRSLGVDFHLVAGAYKDIVLVQTLTGPKVGLYGWYRANGTVIQTPFTGHEMGWLDYSQALRLCRRLIP